MASSPDTSSKEGADADASAASSGDGGGARRSMTSWASKLGQKASQLKSVTKEAVQSTREAIANEAKLVARDMADLKDGVREGVRLTVQDTSSLRERLGRDTDALRKAFAPPRRGDAPEEEAGTDLAGEGGEVPSSSDGPAASAAGHEEKKNISDTTRELFGKVGGFFQRPEDSHLKEKVEDIKAGGKKAAEKVRDVGGKLWQKTDHWLHNLRSSQGHEEATAAAEAEGSDWDECYQRALSLQCSYLEGPGLADWVLQSLSKGMLQDYARTAVVYHAAADDKASVEQMVRQREPCNVGMERRYDPDVLEAKFGYRFGAYASSTKEKLMPNIAIYCRTPLYVGGVSVDVHVINSVPYFFDAASEPDYQYFFPIEDAKWAELVLRMKRLWSIIFECARHLSLKVIFLPDLSGSASSKLLAAPRDFARLREESLPAVHALYAEVDLRPMPELSWIFSDEGKATLSQSLFVNDWNPWSLVGNGGVESASGLAAASALPVLCWPMTNPFLRYQALSLPFESPDIAKTSSSTPSEAKPPPPPSATLEAPADLLGMAVANGATSEAGASPKETPEPQQQQQQQASDLLDLQDPQGPDLGALLEDQPQPAPNGASHAATPAAAEDPDDWLNELENDFVADAGGSVGPPSPAAAAQTGAPAPSTAAQTGTTLADADFDDLWDSMMDDDKSKPA